MIWLGWLDLLVWIYLLTLHGRFWQSGPVLPAAAHGPCPPVGIIVPARDEAETITSVLASLVAQDYPGRLRIFLVDDRSTDGTGSLARAIPDPRLTVLAGQEPPAGWSGKLHALHQGIEAARDFAPELLLLCDADILHAPDHLRRLVSHQQRAGLDLVSEMVALNCQSAAERALVPAFVFFFQLLYPFAWVNDPRRRAAAAAGGAMLVRAETLAAIGGIPSLRGALIDDVTLAGRIKRAGGRIWLGHTSRASSRRPYPGMADIWRMVARTAFVQLRFSYALLAACILGMALVWLAPPLLALGGHGRTCALGAIVWVMLGASYLPTLRRFGLGAWRAAFLPLIALFYMAATIGSALDHARGRGVRWKNRAYGGHDPATTIR